MASASPEPVGTGVERDTDRVAELEAELERSERRRRAAEAWGEFLERELEARDETLECVIEGYERRLSEANETRSDDEPAGAWTRLTEWILG